MVNCSYCHEEKHIKGWVNLKKACDDCFDKDSMNGIR